jgi:lipopolysaccharide biosynthesis glycosyltransferase
MYYYYLSPLFYSKDVAKIIYLDADTLVNADLTPMYEIKTEATFTGVPEYTLIK